MTIYTAIGTFLFRRLLDAKYTEGKSDGRALGRQEGYDDGYIQRGIDDWKRERERHDSLGQFKARERKHIEVK